MVGALKVSAGRHSKSSPKAPTWFESEDTRGPRHLLEEALRTKPSIDTSVKLTATAKRTWVSMMYGSSENMTQLALLQIHSVRRFSIYQHLTMVTPDVALSVRQLLSNAGSRVVEVPLILPPQHILKKVYSWWKAVFSKLNAFNLSNQTAVEFEKVAFIDLDAFLVHHGADAIFDACNAREFCAVRDIKDMCQATGKWKQQPCQQGRGHPMINTGVMLIKPSAGLFKALMRALQAEKHEYAMMPEQEFLSTIYTGQESTRDTADFHFLPESFGQCSPEATSLYASNRMIMHNCGTRKIGELPLCSWEAKPSTPRCTSSLVRLYQEIHVEANHCAEFGQTDSSCSSAEGCVWCANDVRCVPMDRCLRQSNESAVSNSILRERLELDAKWRRETREQATNLMLKQIQQNTSTASTALCNLERVNIKGHDLLVRRFFSHKRCYMECKQRNACVAFTFIPTNATAPPEYNCFLKRASFCKQKSYITYDGGPSATGAPPAVSCIVRTEADGPITKHSPQISSFCSGESRTANEE